MSNIQNMVQILDDYSKFVNQVASEKELMGRITQGIIGVTTEAGELLDMLKKHMFQSRSIDETNIKEECGDIYFYMTELMDAIGTDIWEVIDLNTKNLKTRYPGGHFKKSKSINRDTANERKVLERAEDEHSKGKKDKKECCGGKRCSEKNPGEDYTSLDYRLGERRTQPDSSV